MSKGVASFIFLGKDGWSNGRREETGDQGAHKNVQEAWLYIRALEILLARERREKESKGERESRWQLPITSRQGALKKKKKMMSGGVDVDGCRGVRVDGFVCACIAHYSQTYINKNKLC